MRMCCMQIGNAVVIVVIQTVEGLQIMRIDLCAVIAAQVCRLLPIERVVEVLQMCHVVAQVLVMRVGVVLLLLLLCSVLNGQRRRLLLCNWRSSVCVAIGLETVAAAVQRQTVAAAVAAVVAVVV